MYYRFDVTRTNSSSCAQCLIRLIYRTSQSAAAFSTSFFNSRQKRQNKTLCTAWRNLMQCCIEPAIASPINLCSLVLQMLHSTIHLIILGMFFWVKYVRAKSGWQLNINGAQSKYVQGNLLQSYFCTEVRNTASLTYTHTCHHHLNCLCKIKLQCKACIKPLFQPSLSLCKGGVGSNF